MSYGNPQDRLSELTDRPMGGRQIVAVGLAILLNALDGFDVLAITFAAPGIARAWGTGPAQLGFVLSAGLAGMALGSLLLAPLGDRYGRRPLILGCLILMAGGTALTATATSVSLLCVWRVITGLGIGGMLAAINAVAAEFSNEKRRDLSIALMTIGYPAGGLISGLALADIVASQGWQSIFWIAGAVTALFLPLTFFGLPESLVYLARQRSPAAAIRLARLRKQLGLPSAILLVSDRRDGPPALRVGRTADLFDARLRSVTFALTAAYFVHMLTFYFFSGWLPKMMSDLGFGTASAIRTSALLSLGGLIGGTALGFAAPRLGLRRLTIISMVATTIAFLTFARMKSLFDLQFTAFVAGAAVFGGIVGIYALMARAFPAELRVTGTGFVIAIGRGGSIVGPVIGGYIIAAGTGISAAIAIVGIGGAIAGSILALAGRLQPLNQMISRNPGEQDSAS